MSSDLTAGVLGFLAGAAVAGLVTWFLLSRAIVYVVVRDPQTGDIIRVEKRIQLTSGSQSRPLARVEAWR